MLQIKAILFSLAAQLLLLLAIATIRLMQWLCNHRLIGQAVTDRFFRVAKQLEQRADRLVGRADRQDLTEPPSRPS